MSEAVNRLDSDPPVLRALLVAAGDDREVSAQITRAYYGVMEGAHSSPSVMHAILLSAIYNAFLRSLPSSNGNGVSPGQLKSSQLEAITVSLKALPGRDDVASKKDLQRIEQAIQKIEKTQDRQSPGQSQTEHWASRWVKIVCVGFIVFGLGYLFCWFQVHKEVDARVNRVINAQPSSNRAQLFLAAHQGSISLGPLAPAEGHNETQGLSSTPAISNSLRRGFPQMGQP